MYIQLDDIDCPMIHSIVSCCICLINKLYKFVCGWNSVRLEDNAGEHNEGRGMNALCNDYHGLGVVMHADFAVACLIHTCVMDAGFCC